MPEMTVRWLCPADSADYTVGVREFQVVAQNLSGVIKEIDRLYPGLGEHLEEEITIASLLHPKLEGGSVPRHILHARAPRVRNQVRAEDVSQFARRLLQGKRPPQDPAALSQTMPTFAFRSIH
jgi:hypothetical protein